MNKLLVILFLAFITNAFAQKDTLYFDVDWKKTTKNSASFYRPLPLKKVGDLYKIEEYHSNGNLQLDGFYSNIDLETFEGQAMWYYDTSQLAQVQHYKNGKRNGEALYYSKNGDLRAKGIYKNDTPFNGYFFEFESATSALSNYVNGEITGKQYVGYNDDESLIVLDSIHYKSGKPYQGKLIEHYGEKLHNHSYNKGVLLKTVLTYDFRRDIINNTISYSKDGFIVTDKDSELVMFKLTYLNESKTKAKVMVYSDVDQLAGTLEYHDNKITAIDVSYTSRGYNTHYKLIDKQLVVIAKNENIMLKVYPNLEEVAMLSYKNFVKPKKLFMEFEAVIETYIDNKKVARGTLKNKNMFSGVHVQYNKRNESFVYFKFDNGNELDSKDKLTKKELLKLLKK